MVLPRISSKSHIILHTGLIVFLAFAIWIIALETRFWVISCWLGVILIAMVFRLIQIQQRSRKAFHEFLTSVNEEDFHTLSTIDETDKELRDAYQVIHKKFRQLRIQKERHYHYLTCVIEHVDTALICLDKNQRIHMMNRAAKELLMVSELRELSYLKKLDNDLVPLITKIKTGQREMIRLIRHGKLLNLSVRATEFTLEKDNYKIVSLHDIKTELEEQEVESWHKLFRVLTHEIMNSTIPITNLVGIAGELLVDETGHPKMIPGLEEGEIDNLVLSLKTAESRSNAMINFVQTTKSLTQIPEPKFKDVFIEDLFIRIKSLFKKEVDQRGIDFKVSMNGSGLNIKADLEMIEQVLINLIRNAIEALEKTTSPKIELSARQNNEMGVNISIRDNGPGIKKENLEHIFVPFFSTKVNGTGVGLSLSRQIMKLHKGRIEVKSNHREGTCFNLEF